MPGQGQKSGSLHMALMAVSGRNLALHQLISIRVDGNGKRRPPFPFPRRKRPFPCGNGTAVSMWKRDVVSPAARAGRQAPIVWAALP
eukprot:359151-Chlamydomonas_euryale.AAC.1